MVVGCGIVFFFLIKRAKATYCENEMQPWEVVERKYYRKMNRVILLYTCVLILFYLLAFFWLKENGISFPSQEKNFFLMYFLIFLPITLHIELNYRHMEKRKREEQNLSQLKGIHYLMERRRIQKREMFSFLFAFMIVVWIFWITEANFLFTGVSNKPKVIDLRETSMDSEMMWEMYLENYQPEVELEEVSIETEEEKQEKEKLESEEEDIWDGLDALSSHIAKEQKCEYEITINSKGVPRSILVDVEKKKRVGEIRFHKFTEGGKFAKYVFYNSYEDGDIAGMYHVDRVTKEIEKVKTEW